MYLNTVLKRSFIYNRIEHIGFYKILNAQTYFEHNDIYKYILNNNHNCLPNILYAYTGVDKHRLLIIFHLLYTFFFMIILCSCLRYFNI